MTSCKSTRSPESTLIAGLILFTSIVLNFLPSSSLGQTRIEQVRNLVTPGLVRQLSLKGFKIGQNIFVRIFKESSELEVWLKNSNTYNLFKTYEICNYSGALGPKLMEGDGQSPEGFYHVTTGRLNPNSAFHLSFDLGFPNKFDRAKNRTGSYLMVHGNCVSIGCYAMTDRGIEEIYLLAEAALRQGQGFFRVQAFPFRMTPDNILLHSRSEWINFWLNLKQGYDYFEKYGIPPDVVVADKQYRFTKAR